MPKPLVQRGLLNSLKVLLSRRADKRNHARSRLMIIQTAGLNIERRSIGRAILCMGSLPASGGGWSNRRKTAPYPAVVGRGRLRGWRSADIPVRSSFPRRSRGLDLSTVRREKQAAADRNVRASARRIERSYDRSLGSLLLGTPGCRGREGPRGGFLAKTAVRWGFWPKRRFPGALDGHFGTLGLTFLTPFFTFFDYGFEFLDWFLTCSDSLLSSLAMFSVPQPCFWFP